MYLATLAGEGDSGPGASPQQYALKQLICQSREQFEEAETELQALQMFGGHVNIIRMIGMSLPLLLSVVTLLLCLVMMLIMMMSILTSASLLPTLSIHTLVTLHLLLLPSLYPYSNHLITIIIDFNKNGKQIQVNTDSLSTSILDNGSSALHGPNSNSRNKVIHILFPLYREGELPGRGHSSDRYGICALMSTQPP